MEQRPTCDQFIESRRLAVESEPLSHAAFAAFRGVNLTHAAFAAFRGVNLTHAAFAAFRSVFGRVGTWRTWRETQWGIDSRGVSRRFWSGPNVADVADVA
jgi:hypothetical protein